MNVGQLKESTVDSGIKVEATQVPETTEKYKYCCFIIYLSHVTMMP